MKRSISTIALAGFLASCGGDVQRTLTLQVALTDLPHVETEFDSNELRLVANQVEPLEEAFAYVAWAVTSTDTLALGVLEPTAATLTVSWDQLGIDASAVTEVVVTEEPRDGPLSGPSSKVRFHGALGEELPYSMLEGLDLDALSASVTLDNRHMAAEVHGLPDSVDGLSYAVWLGFKYELHTGPEIGHLRASLGSHDAADPTPSEAGHDETGCEGPLPTSSCMPARLHVGRLADGVSSVDHEEMIAGAWWAFVTIESDNGHDEEMSPIMLLWGEVDATTTEGSESGGGGGGHIH